MTAKYTTKHFSADIGMDEYIRNEERFIELCKLDNNWGIFSFQHKSVFTSIQNMYILCQQRCSLKRDNLW